jgi:hypothetical protein
MRRGELAGDAREQIFPDLEGGIARGAEIVREWERTHPTTLEGVLDWIEELRRLFGDPPVGREPWRGGDFRL